MLGLQLFHSANETNESEFPYRRSHGHSFRQYEVTNTGNVTHDLSSSSCLSQRCDLSVLWHHEFWTLRVFFSDPWLRVVWAHASEWRLHPFLLLLPLVSPGLQKRWGLFQTLKVSLCVIKHSEDAASQIVPSLLNFLCVVCLCQSYSTRMCLRHGRSSGSPLASPPSTLSCSLHLLWWRCTGILSWTTTWTSLI